MNSHAPHKKHLARVGRHELASFDVYTQPAADEADLPLADTLDRHISFQTSVLYLEFSY